MAITPAENIAAIGERITQQSDLAAGEVFPHARPAPWLRALSWSLDRGMRLGLLRRTLNPDALMAEAEARTGLHDWGQGFRRDALETLLASGDGDARLNLLGRIGLAGAARRALCNWLRLVDARKTHPDEIGRPIERPIVIAGMPRTGSTFMQHLLARHPDVRHLPMWLASQPLPAPSAEEWRSGGDRARRKNAAWNIGLLNRLIPALEHIHPYGVDLPVECTHLMSSSFFSNQWAAWPVYSFFDWMAEQDPPSYQPYREQLAVLQAHIPGEGWVLKSPGHFIGMSAVYEEVPEALIVHLHRDPAKVMPSLNSMMACHHLVFTDDLDFQRASDSFLATFVNAAERVMALREHADPERFVDVGYRELKDDPMGIAKQIYERVGLRWDDEVRDALQAHLSRARNPSVRHSYPHEQFGQTPENLRAVFGAYMQTFGVVEESTG